MGRVAVVTGGASGVGLAVCDVLAAAGHRVVSLDLPEVDVADRSSVDSAMDAVRSDHGPIGILVPSAAVASFERLSSIGSDLWDRTIAVNLTGTFRCIQAVVPDMVGAGWGRIVTISSAAGQQGSARQAHYAASKGGVIALTKAVALELAPKGITANSVAPFAVDTPMLR